MKLILFVLCAIALICSAHTLTPSLKSTQQRLKPMVHCVFVADTKNDDPAIGKSCERDMEKLEKDLRQQFGGTVVIHKVAGDNYTRSYLLRILDSLEGITGTVMVYVSGVGGYEPKTPKIHRRITMKYKETISTVEFESRFPKAIFKIFIIDACGQTLNLAKRPPKRGGRTNTSSWQSLLSGNGTVWMVASQPEEFAYGSNEGGFFSTSLLGSIHEASASDNWLTVFEKAREQTIMEAKKYLRNQHPIIKMY